MINFELETMELVYKGELDIYKSPVINICFESKDGRLTSPTKCLIDTGSYYTMIHRDFVKFLELNPLSNRAKLDMPEKGIMETQKVEVSFVIDKYRFTQQCAILNGGMDNYSALIGTEFLKNFNFIYEGLDNSFSLYIK